MSQHNTFDDRFDQQSSHSQGNNEEQPALTLRALVSTKEAGVIIGKAGKNVAELRDATGVKAGVSKVVQGVHDRVLTVAGSLEGVTKAYKLIAQTLLDNPPEQTQATEPLVSIRLLISHNLMGTLIGRQGMKIKQIQDESGVRMIADKDMLPQSTERTVKVIGSVDDIYKAFELIGTCLIDDRERGFGTILYKPENEQRRDSTANDPNMRTQQIAIPSDMVGCIIGKGGKKIAEIRRLSGSRISIAKLPHLETQERMFTIQGTAQSNERALYLLYAQLEGEKERRLNGAIQGEDESVSPMLDQGSMEVGH